MSTNKPPTFADMLIERLTDEQYEQVDNKLKSMKDTIKTFKTQAELDKLIAEIIGDLFGNEKDKFIKMDNTAKLEFLFNKMSTEDRNKLMQLYITESNKVVNPAKGSSKLVGGKRNKSKKHKRRNSRSKRRKTVSKRRR